ncbi:hypothetical protein GGI12_002643 [Dipsacomyces acuminosporus]|nr:hypothetical protein GGI12_002643 [Dipsacomyces acuminosporus]
MRVFVIPITKTRWALHCHPTNITPTRLTRWAQAASERWSKWSAYPKQTWRGKVYDYGERLMDKIDFTEYFLKEIPTKEEGALISKVDVVAPGFLSESEIVNELKMLSKQQDPYHSKWLKICCYMAPVSSLFTLVPFVPNFPLFYNLFRIYSHYKARHGARHLAHLLDNGAYEVTHDSELSRWYSSGPAPLEGDSDSTTNRSSTWPPSGYESIGQSANGRDMDQDTIENGLPLLEDPPLLTDSDIAHIASYFGLPMFEASIRRARHQIIARLSKTSP